MLLFFPSKLKFCAVKKNYNYIQQLAQKHGNVTVEKLQKFEIQRYKKKLKLDIDFLNNCKQLGVYPKSLIFRLLNVSNKVTSIWKRLLHSTINKRNKELQHVSKEVSLSENFLSK